MIVYLLLNTVNLKGYVGQHLGNSIETRWNRFLSYPHNKHLRAAIKKYGYQSFSREILAYCSSEEEMNNLEKLWITVLRTYDPNCGYNKTFGGEGGWKRTADARENNRIAHVGIKYLNRKRPSFYNRKVNPPRSRESNLKRSAAMKAIRKLQKEAKEFLSV